MNGDITPAVIRGIMLEYQPRGPLDHALKELEEIPWRKWAVHIYNDLHQLHLKDMTHMDLKALKHC